MNTQLDTDVRAALEQRRGDWQTIARESGVSYSWISKFVNGHIPNPGFTTLKDLHGYLVGLVPMVEGERPADEVSHAG